MISTFRRRRARDLCEQFGKSYDKAAAAWRIWKAEGGFCVTPHMQAQPRRFRTRAEGEAFESFIFCWCEARRRQPGGIVLRCWN